ncbi:MAG: hypothetical protein EHM64_09545 [Ignavibacteriae bacterium]|nr:MAG: hypothetical protein EHM64_09545 [Ignavibacteriota bacterium]
MNVISKLEFYLILAILLLCSCSTPPKIEKEAVPNKPESFIQIASINLSGFNKRMDRNHIQELVKILKSEQIEILAVQGISRYPGIASRVDFVNEVTARTDWRNAFGEMLNVSGKQTGNAIFSVYPILNHQNVSWENVKPSSFEAALHTTVDVGSRSLMFVTTQLPSKATASELAQCSKLIAAMNPDPDHQLIIVAGNMPADDGLRAANLFAEVPPSESARSTAPTIWYSANASIQLLTSRSLETDLGTLLIAQFGLVRQQQQH